LAQNRIWKLLISGRTGPNVFEEELLLHLDALYSLACRLTRNTETAADLLQDTALRAFQKHHQLRQRASMRPWLVRIMTTTYLNRHVRQTNLDELTPETEPISFTTPESELLRRSSAKDVEMALATLHEEARLTVLLSDVEDVPLREIAEICRCPIGTVASRLARGRKDLRERLAHLQVTRKEGS